jgi:hypothetical protein
MFQSKRWVGVKQIIPAPAHAQGVERKEGTNDAIERTYLLGD